jgi:hypothetical protein
MDVSAKPDFIRRIPVFLICFLGIITVFLQISCQKLAERNKHVLQVDMSKEHDSGRFKPELGDKVFVAGNFNGWKKHEIMMSDPQGNWIYSANIDSCLKREGGFSFSADTLEFNFGLSTGENHILLEEGSERITIRKIARTQLENEPPVFTYNENFNGAMPYEVTFTVGMNNQETLGFFQPDKGDEVVVSGSFCAWAAEGVALKDEGGAGVYSKEISIKQNPKEPIEYRFRIIPKRKAILPNQGWETEGIRQSILSGFTVKLPYAEFNNVRRVARFIINTREWEKEGKFKPLKGDILQMKLLFDGKENLSDALFQVKEQQYETAFMVPLTVREVQWQVVRNMKEELTQAQNVDVGLNGTIVTF